MTHSLQILPGVLLFNVLVPNKKTHRMIPASEHPLDLNPFSTSLQGGLLAYCRICLLSGLF